MSYAIWSEFEREARANYRTTPFLLRREWKQWNTHAKRRVANCIRAVRTASLAVQTALQNRANANLTPPLGPPANDTDALNFQRWHSAVRRARSDLVYAWSALITEYQMHPRRRQATVDYAHSSRMLTHNLLKKDKANTVSLAQRAEDVRLNNGVVPPLAPNIAALLDAGGHQFPTMINADQRWLGGWLLHPTKSMAGVYRPRDVVVMWTKVDNAAQIADRIVVKERIDDEQGWNWEDKWLDRVGGMPMEAACMRFLENNRNVVKLRGYWVEAATRTIRLYIAYCAFKDVHELYWGPPNMNVAIDERYTATQKMDFRKIPEPMLWHLFDAMMEALVDMQNISVTEDGQDVLRCLVHRDIKPENIFLDENTPAMNGTQAVKFPSYPLPRLADFGQAFLTWKGHAENPLYFLGWGTEGWRAPEQLSGPFEMVFDFTTIGVDDGGNYPMSNRSNLWSVARIIHALMNHEMDTEDVGYHLPNQGRVAGFRFAGKRYSKELRHLVLKCLRPRPADRPRVPTVRRYITNMIANHNVAHGMDTLQPDGPRWDSNPFRIQMRKHRWAVGRPFSKSMPPSFYRLLPSPQNALDASLLPGGGAGPPLPPPPSDQTENDEQGVNDIDDDGTQPPLPPSSDIDPNEERDLSEGESDLEDEEDVQESP